jgi:WD40 repeat protein
MEHRKSIFLSADEMLKAHQEIAQRQPVTLQGHEDTEHALAVLPDDWVVSGCDGGDLKLWDMHTQQCIALNGHKGRVTALAVLYDGQVVSGSYDSTLKLWDMYTQQCIANLGHEGRVTALAVLYDGQVVSGSYDNSTLKLWDMHTQQCIALKGHKSWVTALAVLPDGQVVSSSYDKTLKLWDMHKQQCLATLQGHQKAVSTLAVLSDDRVVSGSDDKTLKLWDVHRQQCLATLQGHESGVAALAVLSDDRVMSCSYDTLKLWDMNKKQCLATFKGHKGWVTALAVLSDDRVVSCSWDKTLKLWDVRLPAWALGEEIPVDPASNKPLPRQPWPVVNLSDSTLNSFQQQFNQRQPYPQPQSPFSQPSFSSLPMNMPSSPWMTPTSSFVSTSNPSTSFYLPQEVPLNHQWQLKRATSSVETPIPKITTDQMHTKKINANFAIQRSGSQQCISIDPNDRTKVVSIAKVKLPPNPNHPSNEYWRKDYENETGIKIEKPGIEKVDRAHINSDGDIQKNIVDDINSNFRNNHTQNFIETIFPWADEVDRLYALAFLQELKDQRTLIEKVTVGNNLIVYLATYYYNISYGNASANRAIHEHMDLHAPKNEEGKHSLTDRSRYSLSGAIRPDNTAHISLPEIRGNYVPSSRYGQGGREHKEDQYIDITNTTERTRALFGQVRNKQQDASLGSFHNQYPSNNEIFNVMKSEAKEKPSYLQETDTNIPYEELNLVEELAGTPGSSCVVYKGIWQGIEVACKKIKTSVTGNYLKEFQREANILTKLRSPYIVHFWGISLEKNTPYIIMELCQESLFDRLHSTQEITWEIRISWGERIAYGLAYLHKNKIIHLDLASRNILLDKDDKPKITDFGLSLAKGKNDSNSSTYREDIWSIAWTAPERLKVDPMTLKLPKPDYIHDIYSFGVVLWEIASQEVPLKDLNRLPSSAKIHHITENHYRDEIPQDTPAHLAKLIENCRNKDPQKRPTATEAADYLKNYSPQFFQSTTTTTTTATTASTHCLSM